MTSEEVSMLSALVNVKQKKCDMLIEKITAAIEMLQAEIPPADAIELLKSAVEASNHIRTATYGPYMNVGGNDPVIGYSVSYYLDGIIVDKNRFATKEQALYSKTGWEETK